MKILIFLLVLCGCAAYVLYAFKKANAKSLDISFMQTSSLKDIIDIFSEMAQTDSNYRHYAEVKVTAHGEHSLKAPFSGQEAIYYSNQCFSVTQETHVTYDSNNKKHTRTSKKEQLLSNDTSSEPIFITDKSYTTPMCLDIQSFGESIELTSACDRFEQKNSPFARTHFSGFQSGSNFLGFRLKESILREGQPLYILGELYQMGDTLYFGKAHQANKTSLVSTKSEEQILNDVKKEKMIAVMAAAGVLIASIIFFF